MDRERAALVRAIAYLVETTPGTPPACTTAAMALAEAAVTRIEERAFWRGVIAHEASLYDVSAEYCDHDADFQTRIGRLGSASDQRSTAAVQRERAATLRRRGGER
jgi:hypothetical protein